MGMEIPPPQSRLRPLTLFREFVTSAIRADEGIGLYEMILGAIKNAP